MNLEESTVSLEDDSHIGSRSNSGSSNSSTERAVTVSLKNFPFLSPSYTDRRPWIKCQPFRLEVHWRYLSQIGPDENTEGLCRGQPLCGLRDDDHPDQGGGREGQVGIISAVMSHLHLSDIPTEVLHLKHLNWLDITHNSIREIPPEVKNMTYLRRLACGNNQIEVIPDEIGDLVYLTWLDVTHNRLTRVTPCLDRLQNLAGLGLSDGQLDEFPDCITRLKNLVKLGLFNNRIATLPPSIRHLTRLTKLDMSNNLLEYLPKEVGCLVQLTWLNLSHNRLIALPERLGDLVNLRELGLGSNRLMRLPNLERLSQLTLLPVYNNRIKTIGSWIGRLQKLEKLDLSCNRLRHLRGEIFSIETLRYLNAKRNRIRTLDLSQVPRDVITSEPTGGKLSYFDVSENAIATLPFSLSQMRIDDFKINQNPLRRMESEESDERRRGLVPHGSPLGQRPRQPNKAKTAAPCSAMGRPRGLTVLQSACVNALLRAAANLATQTIHENWEYRARSGPRKRRLSTSTLSSLSASSPSTVSETPTKVDHRATVPFQYPRLFQSASQVPYSDLALLLTTRVLPQHSLEAFTRLRECERCLICYVPNHLPLIRRDSKSDETDSSVLDEFTHIDFEHYGRYHDLPFLRTFCSGPCRNAHLAEQAQAGSVQMEEGSRPPPTLSYVTTAVSTDEGTLSRSDDYNAWVPRIHSSQLQRNFMVGRVEGDDLQGLYFPTQVTSTAPSTEPRSLQY